MSIRPPEGVTTKAISQAARRVERLKIRRRALLKKLTDVDEEIRLAGRVLRDVVRDATAPPPPPPAPPAEVAELGAEDLR